MTRASPKPASQSRSGRRGEKRKARAEARKAPGKRNLHGEKLLTIKRASARHRDEPEEEQVEEIDFSEAEGDVDEDLVLPEPEIMDLGGGARVITVDYDGAGGDRIDAWTARAADLSRQGVVRLIDEGLVTVDEARITKNHRLQPGERIVVDIPPPRPIDCPPENIPLEIFHEDAHLVVLSKPRGMLTHPVGRHTTGTLVNALLGHCKNLSGIGGALRPGIVHRLDRETSGLMVVAKNDKAHQALSKQFRDRTIEKLYLAVVHGFLEHPEGRIEAPIGRDPKAHDRRRIDPNKGKLAISEYRVRSTHGRLSLVEVKLLTGRTHQIRLHLQFLKHPIVGDHLYGRRDDARIFRGTALHSHRLTFTHPTTGKKLTFESPLPADMQHLLDSQPTLPKKK